MSYHLQTNGSNERTNQTVEIALRFFVNALKDPSQWPQVLSRIQAIINNSLFSITEKTPNKLAYGFTPWRFLDFLVALSTPNALAVRVDVIEAISFALFKQKFSYNCRHQPQFIKIGK